MKTTGCIVKKYWGGQRNWLMPFGVLGILQRIKKVSKPKIEFFI